MSKTKKQMEGLLSTLHGNRGTGNTTLSLKGVESFDKEHFVLCNDLVSFKGKKIKNSKSLPLTLNNLEKSRGTHLPISVDVDVLSIIMDKLLHEIDKNEIEYISRLKTANDYIDIAKDLAERSTTIAEDQQRKSINRGELLIKISQMSWWEKIFMSSTLIQQLFMLELKNENKYEGDVNF